MSERDFRLYCADILDSGSAILEFVKGFSFEEFYPIVAKVDDAAGPRHPRVTL